MMLSKISILQLKQNILKLGIIFFLLVSIFCKQVKANDLFVADHRYTAEANLSDYSQCASLLAIYKAAFMATYSVLAMKCSVASTTNLGASLPACLFLANIASHATALAALYAAYTGYSIWAEDIMKKTKIINTIDNTKRPCSDYLAGLTSMEWQNSGPLSLSCYKEEYDHNIRENTDIYNNGEGKIGIEYNNNGKQVWIEAEDCGVLEETYAFSYFEAEVPTKRVFCAWNEGDEICAEAVFCTGLIIGDVMPIYGFVGDPDMSSSDATRKCGKDPYAGNTIDDYSNGRCECYCCDGSREERYGCEDSSLMRCITYNERYNAHCVKRSADKVKISLYAPPATMSSYCSMEVKTGYKDFNFAGRAVRCFEKTMYNIFFGREDKFQYNSEGEKILDSQGSPIFINQCIGGENPEDEVCSEAMFKKMQANLENIISIILIFWAILFGIQFLMGQISSRGELLIHFLKLGFVLFFVQGNAWKEGYYELLLNSSYDLSKDFFDTFEANNNDALNIEESDDFVYTPSPNEENCGTQSAPLDMKKQLRKCNFFDGIDSYGRPYADDEKHFAVLDHLDCKFAKFMLYDKDGNFPKLITTGLIVMFNNPSGIFIFITSIFLLAMLISIIFKVVFYLIVAIIMINFLIFISPIMIPLVMIKRTKEIFDKWLKELIGYSLQPFLILVSLSFLIPLVTYFYMKYLGGLVDIAKEPELREVVLGIKIPVIGESYDTGLMLVNMLKFLFILIVVNEIFKKFTLILTSLTGASAVSSIIKTPDIDKAMKKGAKNIGKGAAYASKYSYARAKEAFTNTKEQNEEKAESNDSEGNDKGSGNKTKREEKNGSANNKE